MNTAALPSWWKRLSARDRLLITLWLAGTGMAALAWCWLALQAAQGRAQALLKAERHSLGAMRMQAEELQRLKQLPAAGGNVSKVDPGALMDSLPKFGLPRGLIQPLSDEHHVNLQGTVPFDRWVEWVAFVQKDLRLVLRNARVTRAESEGLVEIQATLEPMEAGP